MDVGVVGTGRFGRLWAETLASRHSVLTYNRSSRPVPTGCRAGTLAEVASCETVFLCVAISSLESVVAELAPLLSSGTLVMDTCSVKVFPTRIMADLLPEDVSIMGTHPMFGPDSARDGVAGLPLVLCPVRCSSETAETWSAEFKGIGLRVISMTPEEHDREAAFTQGITHFVGRVLADMKIQPSRIATVGYERLLAVMEQTCNDPYQLFIDLQHYNPYTTEMRNELQASLKRLLASLESRLDTVS